MEPFYVIVCALALACVALLVTFACVTVRSRRLKKRAENVPSSITTVVKANCPQCGDVELAASEVELTIYPEPLEGQSYYIFLCWGCDEKVQKPAGDEVRKLLTSGRVPTVHVTIHDEVLNAARIARMDLRDAPSIFETANAVVSTSDDEMWRELGIDSR